MHKNHPVIERILELTAGPVLRYKFAYHYAKAPKDIGPTIILANHNTNLDPALVRLAFGKPITYVATESILRSKAGSWILTHIFNIILHQKGQSGSKTVFAMSDHLKKGNSVLIFPEGNRSFNGETLDTDLRALILVAKKTKASIAVFRMDGGYFTEPRWGTNLRRGRMVGTFSKIYSPDELKVDANELNDEIKSLLYINACEAQKIERIRYKGKKLAFGMESALFWCPDCTKIGGLKTDSDYIFCSCGLKYKYNEYGELEGGRTIYEWDKLQQKWMTDTEPSKISFCDQVTMNRIENHNITDSNIGSIGVDKGQLYYEDSAGRSYVLGERVNGVAVHGRNTLIAFLDNIQYEIKGGIGFSALKYLYFYKKKIKDNN